MKKKLLDFDENIYREFKYLAEADGRHLSDVVNELVTKWVEENEKRIRLNIFKVLRDTPDLEARINPRRQ